MTDNQQQQTPTEIEIVYAPQRSAALEGIINTLEWLLIAFILALVFRAFGVEAFQIPTGSMAETLKGAHYHLRCLRCGYPYDVGGDDALYIRPECPSCGYLQPMQAVGAMQNGDRIFVLKTIYQFQPPKRWDVVVFKNPTNPQINYIKRLIGLPNEKVQIIDGDIFINGHIRRKPVKVQNELWMPIYDNNYQPSARAGLQDSNDMANKPWTLPFENIDGSRWNLNADGPAVFALDQEQVSVHTVAYNSEVGNNFHSFYAYNGFSRRSQPICGDLMMRFSVLNNGRGMVGVCLEKNGIQYLAQVLFNEKMVLSCQENDQVIELASTPILPSNQSLQPTFFEFANVDYRLVLRYGSQRLSFDLPIKDIPKRTISAGAKILGSGKLRISNIGLYRDIFYTSFGNLRATLEEPFELNPDEFFVCGDNSPNSLDSRLWTVDGKNRLGQNFYRQGIVPMDYMMGKAVMVYWSDAFSPMPRMLPIIPNIDQLKVIYGGADELY